MLRRIDQICLDAGSVALVDNVDMLFTILGRPHTDLNCDQLTEMWLVVLSTVSSMYRKNMRYKSGIG